MKKDTTKEPAWVKPICITLISIVAYLLIASGNTLFAYPILFALFGYSLRWHMNSPGKFASSESILETLQQLATHAADGVDRWRRTHEVENSVNTKDILEAIASATLALERLTPWGQRALSAAGVTMFFAMLVGAAVQSAITATATEKAAIVQLRAQAIEERNQALVTKLSGLGSQLEKAYQERQTSDTIIPLLSTAIVAIEMTVGKESGREARIVPLLQAAMIAGEWDFAIQLEQELSAEELKKLNLEDAVSLVYCYYYLGDNNAATKLISDILMRQRDRIGDFDLLSRIVAITRLLGVKCDEVVDVTKERIGIERPFSQARFDEDIGKWSASAVLNRDKATSGYRKKLGY